MSIGKLCLVSAIVNFNVAAWSEGALAQNSAMAGQAVGKTAEKQTDEHDGESQKAQSDADNTALIIVTALRRSNTQQDAAASTSVATSEDIDDRGGVSDPADLVEMLPGVNFVDSGGENNEINIRGSGAGSQGSNDTDSSVAILRDGVQITGGNIAGKVFSRIDTFDLGQAEVVRGPQGSLYGANAVGGVVNLVTNRPKFESGTSGQAGHTPATDRFEVQAIANVPLADTIAVRFGGAIQHREGGFFYNEALKEFGDFQDSKVGRFSILFKPSSNFTNVTAVDVGYETGTPVPIRTSRRAGDIDGPFVFGNNTRPVAKNREFIFTNTTNLFTGFGDITAITSWRNGRRNIMTDADGGAPGYAGSAAIPALCVSQKCTSTFVDNTSAFRQEIRLNSRLTSWLDLLVGANYQNIDTGYFISSDGFNVFQRPTTPNTTRNNGAVTSRSEKQYGAFASAELKLSNNLNLSLAGRYSRSDKDSLRYDVPLSPSAGVTCPYLDPLSVNPFDSPCALAVQQDERRFTSFQPTAAIRYAITPRWAIFASASLGFRPGGFNPNSINNPDRALQNLPLIPETYDSERTLAYELGTKLRAGKVLLTLTGYTNRFRNFIVVGTPDDPNVADDGTARYRFNTGNARNYGVDAEASGRIKLSPTIGTLRLQAAFNYVKGEYTSGFYDNFTIEGTPTETYTLSGTWQKPLGNSWRLAVGGSWRGERGGFIKTDSIDNTLPRASLDVVKARIAVENGRYRFEIVGDNMLNNVYPVYQNRVTQAFADRRSVLFRISYSLGSEERRMFGQ